MQGSLHCISAEMHNQQGVFLVRTVENSMPNWYYIYVEKTQLAIFKGLANFLPLNLPLFEYGKIITSGSEESPPLDIIAQISNGDFSGNLNSDSEVFCIVSNDTSEREFFTYLDVPPYLTEKFKAMYKTQEAIEYSHYGKILHSGWGRPSEEVIAMMKEKYDVDAPIFQAA